jgi:chondroitin 4-sulfotransferase 11
MADLSSIRRSLFRLLPVEWQRDVRRYRARKLYDQTRTEVKRIGDGANALTYTLRSFDERRCIFVHVPKAAGVSVAHALFGHAAGGHFDANEYRMIFGRDFWRYFKFAFVRNPYTRLVSAYEFLLRGGHPAWKEDQRFRDDVLTHYTGFEDFVLRWVTPKLTCAIFHFRPQTQFLTLDGKLVMDFIGKHEQIGDDFARVAERLQIRAELGHRNRTEGLRRPLDSYFSDDRIVERVKEVYAEDFRLLQYSTAVPNCEAIVSQHRRTSIANATAD